MRTWWLAALWILPTYIVVTHAQGGANYTAFGLGQQRTTFGAAYEGLAGAAYAVPSDYLFGIANPALWTLVKTTRVQGGYRFNQQRVEQGGNIRAQNNGKLDGAALLFAIDTGAAIAASIGVFPSSMIAYTSNRSFQIALPDIGNLGGTSTYRGGGGMVTAYAGGATRLSDRFSAGVAILYGFGIISDQVETTINAEASQRAVSTQTDQLATLGVRSGFYADLGSSWSTGVAISAFRPLSIGRTVRYQSYAHDATQPTFDSSFQRALSSPLPVVIGAGLAYQWRRWFVTLDGEWSPSHVMTYRYSPIGRAGGSFRLSLAASYRGSRSVGSSFDDRISPGAGLYVQRYPIIINNNPLDEYGASISLQIPFGGAAMIDAALIGGIRGNGLPLREEFFRLSITLSVGEVWFIPYRR